MLQEVQATFQALGQEIQLHRAYWEKGLPILQNHERLMQIDLPRAFHASEMRMSRVETVVGQMQNVALEQQVTVDSFAPQLQFLQTQVQ